MASNELVTYKGKTYRCIYLGKTKFGRRAKLAFLNNTKEFWVDAALVGRAAASGGVRDTYRRKYGWDGVVGSSSYYSTGLYDEES